MNIVKLSALSLVAASAFALQAQADTLDFSFTGTGVSGSGTLTYTPQAGGAGTITGITGNFSDTNPGSNGKPANVTATITGLVAINPVVPLPVNVSAPDFSQYTVANGVPSGGPTPSTSLSYDNNFYPAGSPVVCTDYPFAGGAFDVYGLLFSLSNGDVVDLWSNGIQPGNSDPAIYGIALADQNSTYDYVGGVTVATPEPATCSVLALAATGLLLKRRRNVAEPAAKHTCHAHGATAPGAMLLGQGPHEHAHFVPHPSDKTTSPPSHNPPTPASSNIPSPNS